jgi:hypothetical protein
MCRRIHASVDEKALMNGVNFKKKAPVGSEIDSRTEVIVMVLFAAQLQDYRFHTERMPALFAVARLIYRRPFDVP